MFQHNQMVTLASSLPLPSAETFTSDIQSRAMPEVLGLGAACLGVMLAVLLIRAFRQ